MAMLAFVVYHRTAETYDYHGITWKFIRCEIECIPVPLSWPERAQ